MHRLFCLHGAFSDIMMRKPNDNFGTVGYVTIGSHRVIQITWGGALEHISAPFRVAPFT